MIKNDWYCQHMWKVFANSSSDALKTNDCVCSHAELSRQNQLSHQNQLCRQKPLDRLKILMSHMFQKDCQYLASFFYCTMVEFMFRLEKRLTL